MMTDDLMLLRNYAAEGSEAAFREVVARHLPLVYGAALRQVGGDRHLAEDVSQHVFAELARCAGSLSSDVVVAGWLYRATRFTAAKVVRTEKRRRTHETAAALEQETERMNASLENDPADWDALCAQLDEAMNELEEKDRTAILLRFFQRLDFHAVGAALHTSDDTAQKKVSRALDKLRVLLTRRGVALSAVGLGSLLLANATAAPPPDLLVNIVTRAGAAAAAAAGGLAGGGVAGKRFSLLTPKVGMAAGMILAWPAPWPIPSAMPLSPSEVSRHRPSRAAWTRSGSLNVN